MEIAAVHAICRLAQTEQSEVVAAAYAGEKGVRPRIPHPKAVRPAADDDDRPGSGSRRLPDSGVALRPVADMDAYRDRLQTFDNASGTTIEPIFGGQDRRQSVAYAEGEEERVLRAARIVVDEERCRR